MRIIAGQGTAVENPADCLTPSELDELQKLSLERERLVERAKHLEREILLQVLMARDRRGLRGRVSVDLGTGSITQCAEEPVNG